MLGCRILLVIAVCATAYGKLTGNQHDALKHAEHEITQYILTGKNPDALRKTLVNFQMPHIFRPDHEHVADPSIVCGICETLVNAILLERKIGASREVFLDEVVFVCEILSIENHEVCYGAVDANLDVILHIADQNQNLTGQKVCALVLQSYDCDKGDNYEWTIDIPEGDTVDKTDPDPSETINIVQISDFHYDPLYTPKKNADCGEPLCCQLDHPDPTSEDAECGYWSEYINADIPWHTVLELIRQVNSHNFDFVYYTGDIISHRVWSTSIENNTRDIKKLFEEFRQSFTVPVYPILGNHEPHPLNVWSSENDTDKTISTAWLYALVAEEWAAWLPEETKSTILRGGYYTVSPRTGFRIIVLNSNVCYSFNWWLMDQDFDPNGQLQWLADTLKQAEDNGEKVHILSHIPTASDCLAVWSREYVKIVNRFANTITSQFNGHTHKDEFSIYYNRSEPTQAINVAFNGASVTPYNDANPSYKLYSVDTTGFRVLDYEEWTFNLTLANLKPDEPVDWYKLYSFKEGYGVNSLEPDEIDGLVTNMAKNHSILQTYYRYKFRDGDSALKKGCDKSCEKSNLCSMVTTEYGNNEQCENILKIYDENSEK